MASYHNRPGTSSHDAYPNASPVPVVVQGYPASSDNNVVVSADIYYPPVVPSAPVVLPTSTAAPEAVAVDVSDEKRAVAREGSGVSPYPPMPPNQYYGGETVSNTGTATTAGPHQQQYEYSYAPPPPAGTVTPVYHNHQTVGGKPQSRGCCGVQLVLFIFGLFFYFPALVGACLPCCSREMMYGRERPGFIANVVLVVAVPAFWICYATFSSCFDDYYW
eukprot:scaffold303517_cov41-Prasinocladus_malaysianus.AAC.1